MRTNRFVLIFCLLSLLNVGCSKEDSAATAPAQPAPPSVSREINQFFFQALSDHGYNPRYDGDWVTLEGSPIAMNGFVNEPKERQTDLVILELIMRLKLADGRVLTQQVVG